MKKFFRRLLKISAIFLAAFALLVAIFYVVENWRGKRAFAKTLAELKARGEPTTIAEIIPPLIPDEINIAATPVFAELFLPDGRDNPDARLTKIEVPMPERSDPKRRLLPTGYPSDLRLYFEEKSPQATDQKLAAKTLLNQDWAPLLEEVREALTHPQCRWPLDYEKGIAMPVPYVKILINLINAFALQARCWLELGESQKAMDDMEAILQFSRAAGSPQQMLTSHLEYAGDHIALSVFWSGLVKNQWNEADVLRMQKLIGQPRDFAKIHEIFLFEQAGGMDIDFRFFREALKKYHSPYQPWAFRMQPEGWFLQEKRELADYYRRIRDCIDIQDRIITVPACDAIVEEVGTWREILTDAWSFPTYSWARRGAWSSLIFVRKVAETEALASQARIACALELWKLRHGRLPEQLDELVPEFLAGIPNQVVDKAPMIYRRVNDQDYLLYSIAWNLKDDGGSIARDKETASKWLDWVWASKPELYREE